MSKVYQLPRVIGNAKMPEMIRKGLVVDVEIFDDVFTKRTDKSHNPCFILNVVKWIIFILIDMHSTTMYDAEASTTPSPLMLERHCHTSPSDFSE